MAKSPTAVCCMAHAVADERALYIQGGLSVEGAVRTEVNQFFALDLTVATWSTSNPPWVWPVSVNMPPLTGSYHSMTVEKGFESLFFWNPFQANPWWTYNVATKYWSNFPMNVAITKQHGIRNGVDMNTGIVYIPSGSKDGSEMVINTPGNPDLSALPMPDPIISESWVWSTQLNCFLHYGGKRLAGNTPNPVLKTFSANGGWQTLNTTGTSPGDLSGHCMVSAYGGKKMVVFGGNDLAGVAKADIYILDVTTLEWTVGKAADPALARSNMACGVSGDSFVSWGGEKDGATKDATPIVYDMKNNQWTKQFNRVVTATAPTGTGPNVPPNSATLPNPSGTSNSQPGSTTNAAAIGGGIAGAMVVAALIGFLLYRRHKRSGQETHDKDEDSIGLSPREPQSHGSDYNKGELHPPSPTCPPLKPRPADDQSAFYNQFTATPLTSHQTGPHAILRNPQGQQQITADSNGGFVDNEGEIKQPSMATQLSHSNDRAPQRDHNDNSNDAPTGSRNPQSRDVEEHQQGREGGRPRGPQLRSLPTSQVQGESLYKDRNQYQDRSQELARMMENIRAEQEELEKSRLEHEALRHTQSHRHP
ncbi:hypothetical protein BGZ95_005972 [Linnemannia exigua]|uniref:Kelch repeat-containing protein n=1 Tax=Linnemannia exigua TaxID=604196 RepID=A0AAD4H8G1_9FUNG|nr:hypothetical protein BGZ95_005972 [Linnemannia exigua]